MAFRSTLHFLEAYHHVWMGHDSRLVPIELLGAKSEVEKYVQRYIRALLGHSWDALATVGCCWTLLDAPASSWAVLNARVLRIVADHGLSATGRFRKSILCTYV